MPRKIVAPRLVRGLLNDLVSAGRTASREFQEPGSTGIPLAPSPTRQAMIENLLARSQQPQQSRSVAESLNIAAAPIVAALLGRREEAAQRPLIEDERKRQNRLLDAQAELAEATAAARTAEAERGPRPAAPTELTKLQNQRAALIAEGLSDSPRIREINERIGILTTRRPQDQLEIRVPGPGGEDIVVRQGGGGASNEVSDENLPTLRQTQQQYTDILGVISSTNEIPGATGVRGAVGEKVGGVLGGVGMEAAGDPAQAFISGADPQVIARKRLRDRAVVAQNMRQVLAEQGARITDTERAIANDIIRITETAAGPSQIKGAAAALMEIRLTTDSRARREEGLPQLFDMSSPEVREQLILEWSQAGLSQELIEQILINVSMAQGLE